MIFASKKQVIFLIVRQAILAIAAIVVATVVISWIGQRITGIRTAVAEKKRLSIILERRSEVINRLQTDLSRIGSASEEIEQAYPPQDNVLQFVETLERLAASHSLIQSLRFTEPVPIPESPATFPVSRISYSITLTGNIANVTNYLKELETLPYMTTTDSLSLNASTTGGWNTTTTVTVSAQLYVH